MQILAGTRRAKVHLNIPRSAKAGRAVYSVQIGRDPVFYVDRCVLHDCDFVIDRRLLQKFEANPRRRTVHAHVRGILGSVNATPPTGAQRIRCNPFLYNAFVVEATQQKAVHADLVVLDEHGAIYATRVIADPSANVKANITR